MIFVAGATGYTGRFLVEALLRAGETVRCLVREGSRTEGLERDGVTLVVGDLERPESFADALEGADAAVDAAHIRFAPGLIAACRRAGVKRALFLSSTWRFSRFRTPEVESVIAGEEAVAASGLEATVLRPTMIFGPGDDRNISRLRDFLRRRWVLPIFGSGERLVQPVYVTDVADAAVAALARSAAVGKAYEIGGARPMPYRAMVDTLCRLLGRTVVKVYIPIAVAVPLVGIYSGLVRSPRVRVDQVHRMGEDRAYDISEAARDLGFAPLGFEEGVREAMRVNGETGA